MLKEILQAQLIPTSREFYNQKSALRISASKNGIFFEIANATGKSNAGANTFGWRGKEVEDSETVKLSESEVLNIEGLIRLFYEKGEKAFKEEARRICGKDFLELYHKTETGDKIISLRVYQGKLFLNISVSKDRRLNFVIFPSEQRILREYLLYVVNKRFQINDTLKYLEYISSKTETSS